MATPHTKLAESLGILRALQNRGVVAVRSADLTLPARQNSPYVNRIRLMWQQMREKIPVQSAMMIMATGIVKCLGRV